MKVYLAAPLFNDMELERNRIVCERLEKIGLEVYLPQRDGGALHKLIEEYPDRDANEIETEIFNMDIGAMQKSDIIIFLLDGKTLDDGSCFELGYMYSLGKKCYAYKTDVRNFGNGKENLMIQKSVIKIFRNMDEMIEFFKQ